MLLMVLSTATCEPVPAMLVTAMRRTAVVAQFEERSNGIFTPIIVDSIKHLRCGLLMLLSFDVIFLLIRVYRLQYPFSSEIILEKDYTKRRSDDSSVMK